MPDALYKWKSFCFHIEGITRVAYIVKKEKHIKVETHAFPS